MIANVPGCTIQTKVQKIECEAYIELNEEKINVKHLNLSFGPDSIRLEIVGWKHHNHFWSTLSDHNWFLQFTFLLIGEYWQELTLKRKHSQSNLDHTSGAPFNWNFICSTTFSSWDTARIRLTRCSPFCKLTFQLNPCKRSNDPLFPLHKYQDV